MTILKFSLNNPISVCFRGNCFFYKLIRRGWRTHHPVDIRCKQPPLILTLHVVLRSFLWLTILSTPVWLYISKLFCQSTFHLNSHLPCLHLFSSVFRSSLKDGMWATLKGGGRQRKKCVTYDACTIFGDLLRYLALPD